MKWSQGAIFLIFLLCVGWVNGMAQNFGTWTLDKDSEKWVETTLKKLSLDEKIG